MTFTDYLLMPVILVLALGGTVLILKLIRHFCPDGPWRDPITSRIEKELTDAGKKE